MRRHRNFGQRRQPRARFDGVQCILCGLFSLGGAFYYAVAAFVVVMVFSLYSAMNAKGQPITWGDQEWLLSWIPSTCCVTNRCCFEVDAGTVESLGDGQWRVVASGQVLQQTTWSKDQRFWRCACDQDPKTSKWIIHPKAHTRCIFPPRPMM